MNICIVKYEYKNQLRTFPICNMVIGSKHYIRETTEVANCFSFPNRVDL